MKKLVLAALLAALSTGCLRYRFQLGPELPLLIVNECLGSKEVVVSGPSVKDQPIPYAGRHFVTLVGYANTRVNTQVLVAQGFDANGTYLGSATATFAVTMNGAREKAWRIKRLENGPGCRR